MPIPEITPTALAERLQKGERLTLLDVREPWEWRLSKLDSPAVVYLPLSVLAAAQGESALRAVLNGAAGAPLVVICHHGVRSARVTAWLGSLGWQNVFSLAGGLEAYARQVDASIGRY
ncbi:MAG: rhodanese-like domain-containing protein [Anaerolineales bacterium]